MSKIKSVIPLLIFFCGFYNSLSAQNQYVISRDSINGSKVLKGVISREILLNDTAFNWFSESQKGYVPYEKAVEALKKNPSIQLIVFMGTWCHDSHFIIPKLFSVLDAAAFPMDQITVLGTDRKVKTTGNLAAAFHITATPTIIIMKDGKELGRVKEYGKYGLFEMELAEIINKTGG
ncbi:MAG: thioredoxin [Terrimonas sp.]|nr:thioredoxin [Terrimonas sp.]